MAKVKVKFRNSTVEGKAGVIYYQLCHKCQSRQITTGIRLFPEQWDALRERGWYVSLGRPRRAVAPDAPALKDVLEGEDRFARDILRYRLEAFQRE